MAVLLLHGYEEVVFGRRTWKVRVCGWKREKRKRRRGVGEAVFMVDGSSADLRAASAFGRPQIDRHISGSHNQVFACVFCESVGYFCFHSSARG